MRISLILCISKILTDLCVIKQRIKLQNIFVNVVYIVLVVIIKVLIEYGENSLVINGKQSAKLKSGSISFKNYFKQLHVPLKIYADFECVLKRVESNHKNNGSYTEKYQDQIPSSFAYKVVCVDNKFSKKIVLYRRKNTVYNFIKAILEKYDYCKKGIKKHVNKNLITSA